MENSLEELDRNPADSTSSSKTEKYNKRKQWSQLPSLPLENIYSYLIPTDQLSMSLVCRNWSEGYKSPSVWKRFKFNLKDSELEMDTCPGIKFARKYSIMFRHVEITYLGIKNPYLVHASLRHFKNFLHIFSSDSQLLSIKFRYLEKYIKKLDLAKYYDKKVDSPYYHDVFRAIENFLKLQHRLKRVEFHHSFFRLQEAVELLKAMTENSRESLTHLVLQRFVDPESIDQEQHSMAEKCLQTLLSQRFPKLATLETDYSLIFEGMFACQSAVLKNYQMKPLSKIILHCNQIVLPGCRGLSSASWKFLKQLCPNIKVELNIFTLSQSRREIEFLIVPGMPIKWLSYKFHACSSELHSPIMKIDAFFNHLLTCKTNDYLFSLCLEWIQPIPDLASTSIPFIQACRKLRRLCLFIIYPANGADILVKSWLENRPKFLRKVHITVAKFGIEDENTSLMIARALEYVPLLKVVGINIEVEII